MVNHIPDHVKNRQKRNKVDLNDWFEDNGAKFKQAQAKGRLYASCNSRKIASRHQKQMLTAYLSRRNVAAYRQAHARAYHRPVRNASILSGGDDSGDSDPDQSDPPLRPYLYQSLTPKLHLNSLPLAVAVTCSRQMSRYPSEGRRAA